MYLQYNTHSTAAVACMRDIIQSMYAISLPSDLLTGPTSQCSRLINATVSEAVYGSVYAVQIQSLSPDDDDQNNFQTAAI